MMVLGLGGNRCRVVDVAVSAVTQSPLRKSPFCENVTSSTKPEVHNIGLSQRRQRRTEPRPHATCTKIGEVRLCGYCQMCERTHKQSKIVRPSEVYDGVIDVIVSNKPIGC